MKICLIGCEGYIGSYLFKNMKYEMTGIDKKNKSGKTIVKTEYERDFLEKYDVIIYLGGMSSRNMEEKDMEKNMEVVKIGELLSKKQILIYASTSAIYEGIENAKENDEIKEELMDNYTRSMINRENGLKKLTNTNTIGLRIATVVGISPKQRSDRVHIEMIKTALFTNRIHVRNRNCMRAIISLEDILKAFNSILDKYKMQQSNINKVHEIFHEIYNLGSYNTTIGTIACCISLKTGAKIIYEANKYQDEKQDENQDEKQNENQDEKQDEKREEKRGNNENKYEKSEGFSINTEKFTNEYGIKLESTDSEIIENLLKNKNRLYESWGESEKRCKESKEEKKQCRVCGNNDLVEVIDLGKQPLANEFKTKDKICEEYPLGLNRCFKCSHNQLGIIVPKKELFEEYIYTTGTTDTMKLYCKNFCDKVIGEKNIKGNVLDIACNDGTQLDYFREKEWKTYGVDPAKNLTRISESKGHNIITGYWGDENVNERIKDIIFDIIIAQNVLAHVPNPKDFLIACKKFMSKTTKIYIQTSQADIFSNGEFDTIYHEHISFFTAKSMLYLCNICDLYLETIDKVPVHGVSYLFVIRKRDNFDISISKSVYDMINSENQQGIYSMNNKIGYKMQAEEKTKLLIDSLIKFKNNNFSLIGYGASAKGNTLLNFMKYKSLSNFPLLEYIVDENPLKQNLYTPGTKIIVSSPLTLSNDTRPLAILILAWNFIEEIKNKISSLRSSNSPTILIVPFPSPYILYYNNSTWKQMSSFDINNISNSFDKNIINKTETLLISHFYNEEFLLPYWISHHAPLFDHVVLIDYHSTDNSLNIIRKYAPSHWKVVTTRNKYFEALSVDAEVRDIEKTFSDSVWKIALTTTEFIIWPSIKFDLFNSSSSCLKLHSLSICGDDSLPLNPQLPLVQQRCVSSHPSCAFDYSRFIYKNTNHLPNIFNGPGRHHCLLPFSSAPNAILFKYIMSPWPQIIHRKLQISSKQSPFDITHGYGSQHQLNLSQLLDLRSQYLLVSHNDIFLHSISSSSELILLRSSLLHSHLSLPWSSFPS